MLCTPTYHVFHMYKYHQDAELLESYLDGAKKIGEEAEYMVPNLQESVSIDKDGIVTVTLNNLSTTEARSWTFSLQRFIKRCDRVYYHK